MHRNLFFFLLFIFGICDVIVASQKSCDNVKNKSTMLQLKRHLLCEYDPDARPVKTNKNMTHVKLRVMPQVVKFIHEKNIFDLHAWIVLSWDDMHLTWDPAQFDDINNILISVYEIWTPDIIMHKEQDEKNFRATQTMCSVSKDGKVRWVIPAKYSTYCAADNTWWPYNMINCTIQFGSWSHSNDEINLIAQSLNKNNSQGVLDLVNLRMDPEWHLLKIDITKRIEKHKYNLDSTTTLITYDFIMSRHWGIVHSTYVTPSIVLMVMTLTTLWLEAKSFERMVLANLNFICHILCIHDVYWEMPRNGSDSPKLLIFYENSLVMASFTLILTSILRHLQELSTEPPAWISTATISTLHSKVGRILLVSILDPAATAKIEADADDNTDLVQTNSKKSPWRYVIVLIGWLAFLSISLGYIILLSICFPTQFHMKL